MKSILIKDTTREEREEIIRSSLDCGGGCDDYIIGRRSFQEVSEDYRY